MTAHLIFDILAWLTALLLRLHFKKSDEAAASPVPPDLRFRYTLVLLLGASIGALVGGSVNTMLLTPDAVGHSVLGALVGGAAAVEAFKWRNAIHGSTGAGWVIPLAVGIAIGRLGCFFAGLPDYTYGTPTSLPWGVDFGDGVPRHPVQLYESAAMALFAVAAFGLRQRRRGWFHAYAFYLFAVFYATQRFVWEFLKPYAKVIGPFNVFHLLCLLLACYGLTMLFRKKAP